MGIRTMHGSATQDTAAAAAAAFTKHWRMFSGAPGLMGYTLI